MKLAIPCERHTDETRVAASPETVKKLVGLGLDVVVETGAGAGASIADADFEAAGASIAPDAVAAVTDADIVFCVQRPTADAVAAMKRGANLIGMLAPFRDQDVLQDYAERGL
ncbi:MAG TPA: NAD(P)(+) transhydrogenase (Re/Si-specific) subunit alpha, partial [Alphaproteobacteria bacterium]|nr:NAD(P)(+) transhydrogenase (Re/Si-specific) subunit alpha [Alphaproteobacteria bacterium]